MTDDPAPNSAIQRLFAEGRLSLGLVLPIAVGPSGIVDWQAQLGLARLADRLGFAALWVRDVPLNSPDYPDPVGHSDPWTLLGALAAGTERIALVTGAIVLPLRHPLHVAKGAVSVQSLSNGRFVLGLGSGDRREEFAAFGRDPAAHRSLFREGWERVAAALGPDGAVIPDMPDGQGGAFELKPAPRAHIPMLAVGSAGQSLEWIARNAAGWATYHRGYEIQKDRIALWRAALAKTRPGAFRSLSQSMALQLLDDPDAPLQDIDLGYQCGRNALVGALDGLRRLGVHHVMLNLPRAGRPPESVLEELAGEVMPRIAGG
nr:TIGR03571 family LLM class oxidoreductase [Indioceanicola profundi]